MAAILIVEDDLTFSRILTAFLEKNDFDVKVAHSVKEALDVLSNSTFELALFDYRLPDGNGLELLQEVKHTHRKPIIMMTSFNDVRTAVKAIQVGAADYILKPVYPDELLVSIRHILNTKETVVVEQIE
jgi:two-component system response regulator HydG